MLTEREAFKVTILQKCAESGMTLEETHDLIKTAKEVLQQRLQKQAGEGISDFLLGAPGKVLNFISSVPGRVVDLGVPAMALAAGVPLGLGLAGGYGVGSAVGAASNTDDVSDVKIHEQIEAYRQETERARVRNLLAERRKRMTGSSRSHAI